jgi:hypothetical protein
MTDSAFTGDASVWIDKWFNTVVVPAGIPAPERLRHRLDRLLENELTPACEQLLPPLLAANDPSVWIIRSLSLDLAVDANPATETRVVRQWSEKLATCLCTVLTSEADSDSVLRFPNRAAYLANFILDVISGSSGNKWYYSEFDSLRSLTPGSAICEALAREPACAIGALERIACDGRLESLLHALHDRDAARLYRFLFAGLPGMDNLSSQRLWTARLLGAWQDASLSPASSAPPDPRDSLRLLLFARRTWPGEEHTAGLHGAIDGLLEFRQACVDLLKQDALEALFSSCARQDSASLTDLLARNIQDSQEALVAFLLQNSADDAHWAGNAAAILTSRPDAFSGEASETNRPVESFLTPFAGIFLLANSYLECEVEQAILEAAAGCEDPLAVGNLLRHLLAIRCLGRPRASMAMADPGMKAFSGLNTLTEEFAELSACAESPEPARLLARTLQRNGIVSAEHLLAELIPMPSHNATALIIVDLPSNEWIYAGELNPVHPDGLASLSAGLHSLQDFFGQPAQTLFLGTRLEALSSSSSLKPFAENVAPFARAAELLTSIHAGTLGPRRTRIEKLTPPAEQELCYFSLKDVAPLWQWPVDFELNWTLFARAILQNFARKLIGFEASTPEYLFKNFLAGLGTIRIPPGKIEVQMPESPLTVLLQLSGMYGTPFLIPWLGEKEICLLAPPN